MITFYFSEQRLLIAFLWRRRRVGGGGRGGFTRFDALIVATIKLTNHLPGCNAVLLGTYADLEHQYSESSLLQSLMPIFSNIRSPDFEDLYLKSPLHLW
jgi:hypothetical protein